MATKTEYLNYLVRNKHSYCFRVRIPVDLQPWFGKTELRYSLKTGYLGQAKSRARLLAGIYQDCKSRIRQVESMTALTDDLIRRIVTTIARSMLNVFDEIRLNSWTDNQQVKAHNLNMWDSFHELFDRVSMTGLQSMDYSFGEKVADQFLQYNEIEVDKDTRQFKKLCLDILVGIQKVNKIAGQWKECDFSTDVDSLFPAGDVILKNNIGELTSEDSKALSEVIDSYAAEFQGSWTEKSKVEIVDDSLTHFLEIVGDMPIQQITRKKISIYKQTIMKLPPRHKVRPKFRNKSIQQILEMDIKETLAPRTVNKHLGRVSTFFDWAKRNGYFEGENPASDMSVPLSPGADDSRAPYSLNDLAKIFATDQYVKDSFPRSYMFWTPIIGLFHGMRQNEIAQIHLEDIKQVKGVWVIDVNDLSTKRVKTSSSRRLVPIHPFLIEELGFLEKVEKMKNEGHDRLFPEITKGRDGYGQTVSKWYNERFRHKIEFEPDPKNRRKDFHSFRTTFMTHLAHKDVSDKKIKQVVGHSRGSDVTNRSYIDAFPGNQLLEDVIKLVDFHKLLDLTHLKNSKYVIK